MVGFLNGCFLWALLGPTGLSLVFRFKNVFSGVVKVLLVCGGKFWGVVVLFVAASNLL